MRAIYLIGFMGAGKTTVGELLSKAYGLPVYDVDCVIEKKQQRRIKDIFATEGEAYFRQVESRVLKELPVRNAIITTGGGVVGYGDNLAWMKEEGTVIYLHASLDTIVERVGDDENRPLFQAREIQKVRQLYESRLFLYEQAHHKIETDKKSIIEIVDEIKQCIHNS